MRLMIVDPYYDTCTVHHQPPPTKQPGAAVAMSYAMHLPTLKYKQSFRGGVTSCSLLILAIMLFSNIIYLSVSSTDCKPETLENTKTTTHGLRAIVTGLEHSGTTLVGSLLYNAPCVIGAFETGYLLAGKPKLIDKVQPWFKWNSAETNTRDLNYRLTPDDVKEMKMATSFSDMYHILRQRSYLFNDLNDEEYCTKPYEMVDKTPLYVYKQHFEKVLEKTPNVPVIVTQKGYEKLKESWSNRDSILTQQFYDETYENVWRMKNKFPNRILIVQEEDLMKFPEKVMFDVFRHVGLEWKDEYLQMVGLLKKVSNDLALANRIQEWSFKAGKHSPDRKDTNT
jgi:hypothetical protein